MVQDNYMLPLLKYNMAGKTGNLTGNVTKQPTDNLFIPLWLQGYECSPLEILAHNSGESHQENNMAVRRDANPVRQDINKSFSTYASSWCPCLGT